MIEFRDTGFSHQPPQALHPDDKDKDWKEANLDWMESYAKHKLEEKNKRLSKNYNIANGIIDMNDYIDEEETRSIYNDIKEALDDDLSLDDDLDLEDLNYYPILPPIINVLVGELSEKYDHIKVKTIDDDSINEYYEYKQSMISDYIKLKVEENLGIQVSNIQNQEQLDQIRQEAINQKITLPHIQKFLNTNYKSNYDLWGSEKLKEIKYKYKIKEKELESFKHELIADEAYWHINILDEDLDIELWSPRETVVIKAPSIKYTTEADVVIRQYKTTIASLLMKYRNKIPLDHIENNQVNLNVLKDDGSFNKYYRGPDTPYNEPGDNISNSAPEKKLLYFKYMLGDKEFDASTEVLVTEGYWISLRKLVKVKSIIDGDIVERILDPSIYEQFEEPIYNDKNELTYGEEVEYFYAPEVWHGTKVSFDGIATGVNDLYSFNENQYLLDNINNNSKSKNKKSKEEDLGVLYIDIMPLRYQFTDKFNPYKPLIPIAGCDGFDPSMGVGKLSLVDKSYAFQRDYNYAMNQLSMFMKTEIGLFYMLDQKLIPRNSIDGTWGKNNFLKFLLTARDTQLGVVDKSASNTEGQQTFDQPTVVNLLKSEQFQSRLQLAEAFKMALYETIGITIQRLGTVSSQETATGIETAVNNSYAQTKTYFENHDNLMNLVYEVALDGLKFIESTKPESRVNYINSEGEQILFEVDTDNLLLKRYNIFLISDRNYTQMLDNFKQLMLTQNTAGASMLELFSIMESNSAEEIKNVIKQASLRQEENAKAAQEAEAQQAEAERQHELNVLRQEQAFEASENDKERRTKMYIAEVNALGRSQESDLNDNSINDALEVAKYNLDVDKSYNDIINQQSEQSLKQKELELKQKQIEADKVNKQIETNGKLAIENAKIQMQYANMANDLAVEDKRIRNSRIKAKQTKK